MKDKLLTRYGVDELDCTPTDQLHESITLTILDDGSLSLSGATHTEEVGQDGTRYIGGLPSNKDHNREFRPSMARGLRTRPGTYQDLLLSDPLVVRAFSDITDGLSAGSWDVVMDGPYSREEEADTLVEKVRQAIDNMDPEMGDLVPQVMRAWGTGFSLFEPVFHRDGTIKKVAFRHSHAVNRWVFDSDVRHLVGAELSKGDSSTYNLTDDALAIARWRPLGADPEGQSALRSPAKLIEAKRLLIQIQISCSERRGSGYLSIEGDNISEEEAKQYEALVTQMLASDVPAIVLPNGVKLSVQSPQGMVPDFDAAIQYLDSQIAIALGIENALVGTGDTGSYALASAKNDEAHRRLGSYASLVERFFNSRTSHMPYRGLIPRMVDAMGGPIENVYPRLVWTPPPEDKNYELIAQMVEKGMLTWTEEDEAKLREELGMSPMSEQARDKRGEGSPNPPLQQDEEEDDPVLILSRSEPDVDSIKRWLTASENHMGYDLRQVGAAHRDEFVQLASNVSSQSEVVQLSENMATVYRRRYKDAVIGQITRLMAQGSASTMAEMGILPNMPRVPASGSEAFDRYAVPTERARDIIDATASRIATKAYNVTDSYLTDQEVREAGGANERKKPDIPTQSAYTKQASSLAARPFQYGREQVSERVKELATERGYPDHIIAEYSSVLEKSSCEKCKKLDGTRTIVGSAEYDRISPPNQCEGGDRCQCLWSYIMPEEAGYDEMLDELAPGWRQGNLNLAQEDGSLEVITWVLRLTTEEDRDEG